MNNTITLDAKKLSCTSCGLCWNEYPAFFGHDHNMLVTIKREYVPESFYNDLLNISLICPGESIMLGGTS
jgi:ferredoxin